MCYIKVWGVWSIIDFQMFNELSLRARVLKSVFVGYVGNYKLYRLLSIHSKVIIELRCVKLILM